jgi:hypothetical protein
VDAAAKTTKKLAIKAVKELGERWIAEEKDGSKT